MGFHMEGKVTDGESDQLDGRREQGTYDDPPASWHGPGCGEEAVWLQLRSDDIDK